MQTVTGLAQLVKEMRDAQKAYFAQHTQSALTQAKALEKRVDQAVEGVLAGLPEVHQQTLFKA
ncbi:MAG: hypothetical protein WC491_05870 [Candidatus Omnitrophota bacterium]|jgi:hypothetical protein